MVIALVFLAGAAQAEDITIAALGDSLTHGYGLATEDGFVPQLQRWLDNEGALVQIINAGVSGDTTAGGLARVGWTLTDEVDGLIVTLGGNDMLRGFDPAQVRANLAGVIEAAQEKAVPVLLIGMKAPLNFGEDYKAQFDAIYPDLASKYDTLLHPNFLRALTAENDINTAISRYMQGDRIHPNADGVALIVDDIGPSVLSLTGQAAP